MSRNRYQNSFSLLYTVIFIQQNYNPILVDFVKSPQPKVQASVDAHQSFLHVEQRQCQDGSSQ